MASISHSSTFTGEPPSEVTASTITSAPCLCAIWVSSFASEAQPVEVSACTKATSLASRFFFSASSSFCGSTGSPHLSSTTTGVPPQRTAFSSMRPPKTPFWQTITLSPGATRLTKQYSMPTEPGPERGKVLGARFDAHRVLGARLVDDVERADAALGDALDLAGPARRHVAGLHPVVHDGAVEVESAGDVGLATEDLHQALGAAHGPRV